MKRLGTIGAIMATLVAAQQAKSNLAAPESQNEAHPKPTMQRVTDPALLAILKGGTSAPNFFDQFDEDGPWTEYGPQPPPGYVLDAPPERLGAGPHTLVISDRNGMTRIDYKSGAACLKARNEVRRQNAPPTSHHPGVIYGPPTTKAFCVPR